MARQILVEDSLALRLSEAYRKGASLTELASKARVCPGTLKAAFLRIGIKLRNYDHCKSRPWQVDPTPAEIEERAAEVRAMWSEEETERRKVFKESLSYTFPRVTSRMMGLRS